MILIPFPGFYGMYFVSFIFSEGFFRTERIPAWLVDDVAYVKSLQPFYYDNLRRNLLPKIMGTLGLASLLCSSCIVVV